MEQLYFCDVTILTVGFGDLYPTTDVGRGIVFPYSVGGIIMLGLVISSIYKFMRQLGQENIIQKHIERMRERTMERTVTSSFDLREREREVHHLVRKRGIKGKNISGPSDGRAYRTAMGNSVHRVASSNPLSLPLPKVLQKRRKPRLILMREEKDRFETMRRIQRSTSKFKKWWALTFSVIAFGILWCVGAIVFWQAEKGPQGMTYFQALYFCYISLLTIGYGDLSPKSNGGRCFFVVWSLIAVPTMTILVSDLGDTVIDKFKTWSDQLADFTVLPKEGIWRQFLDKHPWLLNWLQTWQEKRATKKRLKHGFDTADPDQDTPGNENGDEEEGLDLTTTITHPTIPDLAKEAEQDVSGRTLSPHALSRGLALSIRRVATDLQLPNPKRYEYEEWVEFTRLIRFSNKTGEGVLEEEEEEGLVEWDWIGEDSPLVSGLSEAEWLLNKLTDALVRVERRKEAIHRLEHITTKQSESVDWDTMPEKGQEEKTRSEESLDQGRDHIEQGPSGDGQSQVLASGANGANRRRDSAGPQ